MIKGCRAVKQILILLCLHCTTLMASEETPDAVFTLQQLMKQHQGKVIYVDFWAAWCLPCRQSFPWLNQLQQRFTSSELKIISINLDNNRQFAKDFLAEVPANFEIIYDSTGKVAKQFKIKGMPSSFVFDKQGKLVAKHQGFNPKKAKQYEREIALFISQNQ